MAEIELTLAPECPVHEEEAIESLVQALAPYSPPRDNGEAIRAISMPSRTFKGDGKEDADQLVLSVDKVISFVTGDKQNSVLAGLLQKPLRTLLGCCSEPTRTLQMLDPLAGRIFGQQPAWFDEPIFLRTILCLRHAQPRGYKRSSPLTNLGLHQIATTARLLSHLTGEFRRTFGIFTSTTACASQCATTIHQVAEKFGKQGADQIVRVNHSTLNEHLPPYPYIVVEEEVPQGSETREVLEREAVKMEDARSLLGAALRGQGPLATPQQMDFEPATLCGDIRLTKGYDDKLLRSFRYPPLEVGPVKVGGVYVGHAPAVMLPEKHGAHQCLYVGHANTIRFQIFEEIGFPRHFWRFVHLPHCAVLPLALHASGRPALIIGDAAYTLEPDDFQPVYHKPTLTFTPSAPVEDGAQWASVKGRLINDQPVSLLNERYWFAQEALPGFRYNAPPLWQGGFHKHIMLIRAGHNTVAQGRDAGLSDLGRRQIEAAALWIADLLMSGRVVPPTPRWCTAGLTSQWSSVGPALTESIMQFKKTFAERFTAGELDGSLVTSEDELYPENLFAAGANDHDSMIFVFADDYHLLKYLGACFGIEPATLKYCFWPHSGYVWVAITEEGWPYFPLFGMVSHMAPASVTFLPPEVEPPELSSLMVPAEDSGNVMPLPRFESEPGLLDDDGPNIDELAVKISLGHMAHEEEDIMESEHRKDASDTAEGADQGSEKSFRPDGTPDPLGMVASPPAAWAVRPTVERRIEDSTDWARLQSEVDATGPRTLQLTSGSNNYQEPASRLSELDDDERRFGQINPPDSSHSDASTPLVDHTDIRNVRLQELSA